MASALSFASQSCKVETHSDLVRGREESGGGWRQREGLTSPACPAAKVGEGNQATPKEFHPPVLEPRPAGLCASGPEHPIEAMVDRFELSGVKAIQHITWRILAERGRRRDPPHWQKQDDQIGGALEEPVEPVIGFHTPHSDCTTVHLYCSVGRPCFHGLSCRAPPHRGPYPCIRMAHLARRPWVSWRSPRRRRVGKADVSEAVN